MAKSGNGAKLISNLEYYSMFQMSKKYVFERKTVG